MSVRALTWEEIRNYDSDDLASHMIYYLKYSTPYIWIGHDQEMDLETVGAHVRHLAQLNADVPIYIERDGYESETFGRVFELGY